MNKIIDLFGNDTSIKRKQDWKKIVKAQHCPYVDRRCYKTRKTLSHISIGTCTVAYASAPVIICPLRLLERRQIFTDCIHLLTGHEPGNEIHLVPEITVPGGSIDYIMVSARDGKVRDFVGLELQTLDTTGTVWPERQRFLAEQGFSDLDHEDLENQKTYGMNWKMTAKTILVQLHHKIQTFESVNKHLVLVIQDRLLNYMVEQFNFGHLVQARTSDPMHFHAYSLLPTDRGHHLRLDTRLSTDSAGIATCLGLQSDPRMEMTLIIKRLETKMSDRTRFDYSQPPLPISVAPED